MNTYIFLFLGVTLCTLHYASADHESVNNRRVECEEHVMGPRRNCECFGDRGNADYDLCALNGIIAAYQIKWGNGKFSKWFVPRLNDINHAKNLFYRRCYPKEKVQHHRYWTYFYSHTHRYILCKIVPSEGNENKSIENQKNK